MPQRAAVLLLVLLALLGPGSVWSEEDEEEVDYTRSRLSPGCPEDEVWTGWCAASGPWWVTASAWTFRHLGCFARGDDASHRVVARVAGLRVAGVTAPLQCLRMRPQRLLLRVLAKVVPRRRRTLATLVLDD